MSPRMRLEPEGSHHLKKDFPDALNRVSLRGGMKYPRPRVGDRLKRYQLVLQVVQVVQVVQ